MQNNTDNIQNQGEQSGANQEGAKESKNSQGDQLLSNEPRNSTWQEKLSTKTSISIIFILLLLALGLVGLKLFGHSNPNDKNVGEQKNQQAARSTTTPESTVQNIGSVKENVISRFDITIGTSTDDIRVGRSSISEINNKFPREDRQLSSSAHYVTKVYQDGREEVVPFKLRFCPDYTDVCQGTSQEVNLAEHDFRGDVTMPVEASVEEVRITINNKLAESIERSQTPPKITRFYTQELSKQQLEDRLGEEEYKQLYNKEGTLLKWEIEKGSFARSRVVLFNRADGDWQVTQISHVSASTSAPADFKSEFLLTENTVTSGSGQLDFKLQVSDGFHLVTVKKKNFAKRPLEPMKLQLESPPMAYLRMPFAVTVAEFQDPASAQIYTDKRTIFLDGNRNQQNESNSTGVSYPSKKRSFVLPAKYEIEWSSPTLPLEEVSEPARDGEESPIGLKIAVPKERKYTSLLGKHTVQATMTNTETGISQTATTTFEFASLGEACNTEGALVRGCPTTTTAE